MRHALYEHISIAEADPSCASRASVPILRASCADWRLHATRRQFEAARPDMCPTASAPTRGRHDARHLVQPPVLRVACAARTDRPCPLCRDFVHTCESTDRPRAACAARDQLGKKDWRGHVATAVRIA